jgi:hypothetical protein
MCSLRIVVSCCISRVGSLLFLLCASRRWVAVFRVMLVMLQDVEESLVGLDLNGTVRVLKAFQAHRTAMDYPELDEPEEVQFAEVHSHNSGGVDAPVAEVLAASPLVARSAARLAHPEHNPADSISELLNTVRSAVDSASSSVMAWLNQRHSGV